MQEVIALEVSKSYFKSGNASHVPSMEENKY